jgi:acyl-CoA dehydrogenase
MIGFSLTPEQKAIQEKAGRFAREVVLPAAAKHDREGDFPLEIMQKAYAAGYLTPLVPRQYG